MYPLLALLTPPPLTPFTTEEITGCTNETAKDSNEALTNLPSCLLFHVLLFQKLHQQKPPNLLMVLLF